MAFNKGYSVLELALLSKNFDVKKHKLLVKSKVRLFHKLKHKQVSNVEYLGLKLEVEADQVHGLNCPLGVNVLLELLVKG